MMLNIANKKLLFPNPPNIMPFKVESIALYTQMFLSPGKL